MFSDFFVFLLLFMMRVCVSGGSGCGVCWDVCGVCGVLVFGVNRGHIFAHFHTNEDTHDNEDRPRFLDRCNRSKTA